MTPVSVPKLPHRELQEVLDRGQLPSLPSAVVRLIQLAADPEVDLGRISTAVSMDPALAARVIGRANSPLYRRGEPIRTVDRAVAHLGIMHIRSLALAVHLFQATPVPKQTSFDYRYFWRYCLTCAVAAKLLGLREDGVDAEEAFVAGLLQDIGVLALQRAFPKRYGKVLKSKSSSKVRLHEREFETWGYDHADVGAAIAAQWGLPPTIGNAIRLHHRPGRHALADLCHSGDAVHAAIYEATGALAARRVGELRARLGDGGAVFEEMEAELPRIAEACACPNWNQQAEGELKERIRVLLETEDEPVAG